ncbi:30S ribosomal protein S11, chloroplastic, partial [Datura stramonium]|nr:30S ribosomal protein S11, chloroplastic [Datura stramonium]
MWELFLFIGGFELAPPIVFQESFNNTIVTVTDVRGRVVSWSSVFALGNKKLRVGRSKAGDTAPTKKWLRS